MKFMPLVLLLILAACMETPQEEIASGYARLAATEQAQAAQQAAQVEQARQATESAMQTAEAAQSEIDLMNAEAHGTLTAIESQSQAIAVGMQSYAATQAVWADSLHVTETMQPVQATQTAQPTMMAAALKSADAKADQMQVIANILPFLMLIILLGLTAAVGIGLKWLYLIVEWGDRKNGQVNTKLGLVQYRKDGKLIDRAPIAGIQNLNDVIPQSPYQEDEQELPELPEIIGPREQALDLLETAIEFYGQDTDRIPTWRAAKISSDKWQTVINYLKSLQMVYTTTQGTHTTAPVRDVIYRLESTTPTPENSVR